MKLTDEETDDIAQEAFCAAARASSKQSNVLTYSAARARRALVEAGIRAATDYLTERGEHFQSFGKDREADASFTGARALAYALERGEI
jgi:hypothetical protein